MTDHRIQTYMTETPSMQKLMQRWSTFVNEGMTKEQEDFALFRKEVLAEPLPDLTGEQWVDHVMEAVKAVMNLPPTEGFQSNHPAVIALNKAYIKAEAAGWRITMTYPGAWKDSTTKEPIDFVVTFDYVEPQKNQGETP